MPVRRPVCLICLIFILIIHVYIGFCPPAPLWDVDGASGVTVTISGKVVDKQNKNGSFQIFLNSVSFLATDKYNPDQAYFPKTSKGIVVKLSDTELNTDMIRMGSIIEARGVFTPFEPPRCEGMFDLRRYYMIRGYEGQLKRARVTGVSRGYNHISEPLRRIRDRAVDILKENMSAEDAGLVAAMTLGDKTGLDSEIKELYQNAGISHVLALSGLHIASVGLALLKLLKKTGIPQAAASLISGVIIAGYAIMTGLSTSTVRAMIMFALFVVANILGRSYDILSAAALSAILILTENPYYIYDSGFLLSFGAVLGIACIYPVFTDLFPKCGRLYQSICITVSVMVATFPVAADSFMQISLCSVFINLLVIPLMSFVLITGFAGIVTGLSGPDPSVILRITHYILYIYKNLGKISEKIDGNILITGKPEKWQIITYAVILIIVVNTRNRIILNNIDKTKEAHNIDRAGQHLSNDNASNGMPDINKITYSIKSSASEKKTRSVNLAVTCMTAVIMLAAMCLVIYRARSDMEIRNVDVGQGDCALIWGNNIPVIMIDGGSSDIKSVGSYRIEPVLKANRISCIDFCFLTHMDSDHVNGVLEILEDRGCGIRIKNVIVSDNVLNGMMPSDNRERLIEASKEAGTVITGISAGDTFSLGDTVCECLSPKGTFSDENDDSLVLSLYYNRKGSSGPKALFTGDISENVESKISGRLGEFTYLKVAHHGSRYSSSEEFLKKVRPKISVISAGVGNSYGHPHKEVLGRLKRSESMILCTAGCGQITVRYEEGRLSVGRFLNN